MAPSAVCKKKLMKEYKSINESPPDYIPLVHVNEKNITDWHFVIKGPPDSAYAGGLYVGRIKFPDDYPFKPPSLYMVTPNGRFATNNTKLCLSMSDFHPESWSPGWNVATVLMGLLSFMLEDAETTGSIKSSTEEKQKLASESIEWNNNNTSIKKMFPDLKSLISTTEQAKNV